MTETNATRATGAALTAAVAAFIGTGPTSLAVLMLTLSARENGRFGALFEVWANGGVGNYVVLLAGAVVSAVCAVTMFFGVQRGSVGVLAGAPLAALITVAGAFGFWLGIAGVTEALAHVNPLDAATILVAGTGEALSACSVGLAGSTGLLLMLALGCLFGVAAQSGQARMLLAVSGGLFVALALISALAAFRTSRVLELFSALSHVNPLDRPVLLVGGSEELEFFRVPQLALLGVLVTVIVGGALSLKATPRTAMLVPLLGFGGLVGLGAQALARSLAARPALSAPRATYGLVEFDGFLGQEPPTWCLRAEAVEDCEAPGALTADRLADETQTAVRNRTPDAQPGLDSLFGSRQAEPVALSVGVASKASAGALATFMGAAVSARATGGLVLMGERQPEKLKVVAELAVVADLLQTTFREVPVRLHEHAQACTERCVQARLVDGSLTVNGEKWAFEPELWSGRKSLGASSLTAELRVDLEPGMTPEQVMTLARIAASHDHTLVLRLVNPVGD